MKQQKPNEKLVEVYKAKGEGEAHVIQGKLESNGIPSVLRSLAAPSIHVFILDGMGEYRVMVPESMVEDAKQVIEGDKDV
jgi:hypothetical protein